jgi:hypothetical protein
MEIPKYKFAVTLILVSILFLSIGYSIPHFSYHRSTMKANVFFAFETFHGEGEFYTHNVITNIGENYTRNAFSGNQWLYAVAWISIGNAIASTSLTQLTTEYDRQLGTIANWTNNGDYAFNATYKWTFTETVTLDCAGLHWASSGDNNLYAVANFPDGSQKFNSDENMTATWVLTYNCN